MANESKRIMEAVDRGENPKDVINEALTRTQSGAVSVPDEINGWEYQDTPPARIRHADSRFMKCRVLYVLEDDHPAIVVARVDRNEYRGYKIKVGVYDDAGDPRVFDRFSETFSSVNEAVEDLEEILERYDSVQQYIDDAQETKTAFDRTQKNMPG